MKDEGIRKGSRRTEKRTPMTPYVGPTGALILSVEGQRARVREAVKLSAFRAASSMRRQGKKKSFHGQAGNFFINGKALPRAKKAERK